jgi:hypothetical protein
MRSKKWTSEEVDEIVGYLLNVSSNTQIILKLRNRKGVRCSTLDDEIRLAIRALRLAVAKSRDGSLDQSIESWIADYIVDGGRERLIEALKKRRQRGESEPKPEPKPESDDSGARLRRLFKQIDDLNDDEARAVHAYLEARLSRLLPSKRDRPALIDGINLH